MFKLFKTLKIDGLGDSKLEMLTLKGSISQPWRDFLCVWSLIFQARYRYQVVQKKKKIRMFDGFFRPIKTTCKIDLASLR